MVQLLLSCYLRCSGLLSVGSFLTFKFLSPLDEPKPGNPFVFLPFSFSFFSFYLLCVIPSWTRPIERISASPSLHQRPVGGGWGGGGGGGGGSANHWGSKVSLQQARGACRGGNRDSVFSEAHKPDHRGNNGTIIGCAYSCAQRISANEVLTRARANDPPTAPPAPQSGWVC